MSFFTSIYRQITALDLDEIFSYQTTKEVRMLDRRLGMVNLLIKILVLLYLVGYVFLIREGYTEIEKSVGETLVSVNGTAYSTNNGKSRPWDSIDVVNPALENGATIIASTVYVTPGQVVGTGNNPNAACSSNSDCTKNEPLMSGTCNTADGYCQELAWMPAFSETDETSTTEYILQDGDDFGVWIRAAIQFPSLDSGLFSTMGVTSITEYDSDTATVSETSSSSTTLGDGTAYPPDYFTVGELLSLAQTSYETIKETGCTLSVSFMWTCFVDSSSSCYPTLQVSRMDVSEKRRGFQYSYANYYRPEAGGVSTRDLYTVKGVRILLSSRGEGKRFSFSAVMLQISSGIALLWLANFAADFLMLHVLPERKHYRTYKQERTPDFSDLRNKIAEVEGEKKKLRDRKNRFAAKLDES
jgi:hypothetical protein